MYTADNSPLGKLPSPAPMHMQTLTPVNIQLSKIIEKPVIKITKFKSMDIDAEESLRNVGLLHKLTSMKTMQDASQDLIQKPTQGFEE